MNIKVLLDTYAFENIIFIVLDMIDENKLRMILYDVYTDVGFLSDLRKSNEKCSIIFDLINGMKTHRNNISIVLTPNDDDKNHVYLNVTKGIDKSTIEFTYWEKTGSYLLAGESIGLFPPITHFANAKPI